MCPGTCGGNCCECYDPRSADAGNIMIPVQGGYVIRKKPAHRCAPPDARDHQEGDVFVCACGRRSEWRHPIDTRDDPTWERI